MTPSQAIEEMCHSLFEAGIRGDVELWVDGANFDTLNAAAAGVVASGFNLPGLALTVRKCPPPGMCAICDGAVEARHRTIGYCPTLDDLAPPDSLLARAVFK